MRLYEVSTFLTFSAAHRLLNYEGNCAKLHGHNWKVELTVRGARLDPSGILIDFRSLRHTLGSLLTKLDHSYLNEVPDFENLSPSAENICSWLFFQLQDLLAAELKARGAFVYCIRVWENERSLASFYGDMEVYPK